MDLEKLRKVLQAYKPPVIAKETGLSRQQVYSLLSGKEQNPKYKTLKSIGAFLAAQERAINELNIQ